MSNLVNKLVFLQDCEIEVVESYDDEEDEAVTKTEAFKTGDVCEGDDLESDLDGKISFQFPDGSCVYNLPTSLVQLT